MLKIKRLVKHIKKELKEADQYYTASLLEDDQKFISTCKDLATKHLDDANELHTLAVGVVNEYKSSGKEVPATMQAIWDYEHEDMIESANDLRSKSKES